MRNRPIATGDGSLSCDMYSDSEYERCELTCPNGQAPVLPIPNVYTCGATGSFNKRNPNERVRLPVCGRESVKIAL